MELTGFETFSMFCHDTSKDTISHYLIRSYVIYNNNNDL